MNGFVLSNFTSPHPWHVQPYDKLPAHTVFAPTAHRHIVPSQPPTHR